VVQYDSEGDFAMVKLKASPPQSFNFRNQLAIEDDLDLYSFSFSPWITIKELEPGCAVYKVGKESNFTCGVYEGEFSLVTTMASNRTVIERKNVVAISALGLNDSAFAKDGDSGSIYYAVRGSFRYPFAIHNGEGYDKIQVLSPDLFPYPTDKKQMRIVSRKVYYGTPLRYALKKMNQSFDDAYISENFKWLDRILGPLTTSKEET
jgi:hypothetical protein